MTEKTVEQLIGELCDAYREVEYWSLKRQGQVGNCISDQEGETAAWRKVQNVEFQIRSILDANNLQGY